ncbi:MAG: transcriptional regulator [Thiotrichales bacterium SG8_50]|nr:MAG: transcriptional regulator [Thiotrichales bacterium SG8_50]
MSAVVDVKRGGATIGGGRGYVLVVDDEPDIRRLVREILEDENYRVATAENAAAAREAFRREPPDLVLLDIWMPDTDGITLLKEWAEAGGLPAPVVMMSGHGTVETAVEATRLGAYDFVEKPLSLGKLLVTVERALEAERLRRENLSLSQRAEPSTLVIGRGRAIRELRDNLERIAKTESWVLVSGEPGSGKALAGRYIHAHSARADRACVEVSLAAIPAQNIAAQLFGSEHNGVVNTGSLEQAHGGTLVLNEVGDLDPATQMRLYNTLAEGRFVRVGGVEAQALDVRIIAITSQDLAQAVAANRFREDLYYLNWMVDHEHLPYRKFTTSALNALRNHSWPGNVRELRNVVQRLLILNRGDEVSEAEVQQALGAARAADGAPAVPAPNTLFGMPLREAREQFERSYLEYHLARTGGNVAEVAKLVEMERTHLYRKLKQLGLHPKKG